MRVAKRRRIESAQPTLIECEQEKKDCRKTAEEILKKLLKQLQMRAGAYLPTYQERYISPKMIFLSSYLTMRSIIFRVSIT